MNPGSTTAKEILLSKLSVRFQFGTIKVCNFLKNQDMSWVLNFWWRGNWYGFQSQYASSPAGNGLYKFTSGTTPADLLTASNVAKQF